MADNQLNTILTVEDRTAAGFRSAQSTAERYYRGMQGLMQGGSRQPMTPAEQQRRLAEFKKQREEQERQNKAQSENVRITKDQSSALASMAARYLSAAYAVSQFSAGVQDLATMQEGFRTMQVRSGATVEQMQRMRQAVAQISRELHTSQADVLSVFETVREAAYLEPNKLEEISRQIISVARNFGVPAKELAAAWGELKTTLDIPEKDWVKSFNIMAGSANAFRLDLGMLAKWGGQLGQQLQDLGLKGTEGLASLTAQLGLMREHGFGDTQRSARTLYQALSQISSGGGIAEIMGFGPGQWGAMMDRNIEAGKNFFDTYVDMVKEARRRGFEWAEIFPEPRMRQYWRMMTDNSGKYSAMQKRAAEEFARQNMGYRDDMDAMQERIDDLKIAWQEMWRTFADEAAKAGLTDLFKKISDAMKEVTDDIKLIEAEYEKWKNWFSPKPEGGERPEPPAGMGWGRSVVDWAERWGIAGTGPSTGSIIGNRLRKGLLGGLGRQAGGPVRSGHPYVVGESGPELFVPGAAGQVLNDSKFKQKMRAALDAYEVFIDFMNATPEPPGGSSTLHKIASGLHIDFETLVDQLLSWGLPRGAAGNILGGTSLARMLAGNRLAGGEIVPLADPIHLLKSSIRYYAGKSTPQEQAYWQSTSMAQLASGQQRLGWGLGMEAYAATTEKLVQDSDEQIGILEDIREILRRQEEGGGMGAVGGGATYGTGIRREGGAAQAGLGGFRPVGGGPTRGNRNNNRGNLKYGAFARAYGATGADDRGFAIFPNQAAGDAAHEALIKSPAYSGLTLRQFAAKYAEGSPAWMATVGRALGIGPDDIVNNQDPRLAGAIRQAEGTTYDANVAAKASIQGGVANVAGYINPVTGTSLSGDVGTNSRSRGAGGHQGVDIMAPMGSPLYATHSGTIEHIGTDNFGQPTIRVRNDDGSSSSYLHVGSVGVQVGQRVSAGDVIGGSGQAAGVPHLHFERRDASGRLVSARRETQGFTAAGPSQVAAANQAPGYYQEYQKYRQLMEQPINIRTRMEPGQDAQFRQSSIRREVDRETREAAWNSFIDIGTA